MKSTSHSLHTVLSLIVCLAGFSSISLAQDTVLKPGGVIPELESYDVMGMPVSFRPPEGKILAILFWDVNSTESIDAVKDAIVLYKRFHDKGLESIAVCTSKSEDPVIAFCDRWMIPFPVVMNAEEEPKVTEQFGVEKTPCNLLIGEDGKILAVDLEREAAHEKVAEILKASLDDLPMPAPPRPRAAQRNNMGMVGPGENEGILIVGEEYSIDESSFGSKAERESVEDCKKNLRKISLALKHYRMDHDGEMPTWLSDLFPTYLQDEKVLLDPKNPTAQTYFADLADPKIPCSFLYEFANAPAGGRENYQAWKKEQMNEYGDRVPVLRCFNYGDDRSLNLSYGGEIYFSGSVWEETQKQGKTPEDLDAKARQQLLKIAVAIDDYKKDRGEVPNELADLIPQYVESETAFRVPSSGLPLSYEFTPNKPNQQEPSLGSTYREWKTKQMEEFGDYVPIVRVNGVLKNYRVLNLSYGGEIWDSDSIWEENLRQDNPQIATRQRMTLAKQVQQGEAASALSELDWPKKPLDGTVKIDKKEQMLPLKGQWVLMNGSIKQYLPMVQQTVLVFEPYLKKGEIRLKAGVNSGDEGVRIVFGFQGPDRYLVWNIGGWSNTVSVVEKWTTVYGDVDSDITDRKKFEFTHGELHDIRLVVDSEAKTAKGYVDGEEIFTLQTNEPLEGRLGLSTYGTAVEFEGIEIEGVK